MKLYREWCPKPNMRKGRMLSIEAIARMSETEYDPGYCSVYAFDEESTNAIKNQQNSKGFGNYIAYSDKLFIDIDALSIEESRDKMYSYSGIISELGLHHTIWFSGSKGYHIVLYHALKGFKDLPYSHRQYVEKKLGFSVDSSIYKHSGLISLPGRIHPRTKVRKHLVLEVPGKEVEFEIVKKPELSCNFSELGVGNIGGALLTLEALSMRPPSLGERHMRLFMASKECYEAGMPVETIFQLLKWINKEWDNPKTDDEIERAMQGGIAWQRK